VARWEFTKFPAGMSVADVVVCTGYFCRGRSFNEFPETGVKAVGHQAPTAFTYDSVVTYGLSSISGFWRISPFSVGMNFVDNSILSGYPIIDTDFIEFL